MKWYSNDKKTKPNLSQSKTGDVDGLGMRLANMRIRTRAGWVLGITLYLLHCKLIWHAHSNKHVDNTTRTDISHQIPVSVGTEIAITL